MYSHACTGKYRDGDENPLRSRERWMCISDFATAVDTIISATTNTTQTTENTRTIHHIVPNDTI